MEHQARVDVRWRGWEWKDDGWHITTVDSRQGIPRFSFRYRTTNFQDLNEYHPENIREDLPAPLDQTRR